MKNSRFLLFAMLLLIVFPSHAGGEVVAQQSHAQIHDVIAAFVHAQTSTLPGQVSIQVDELDPRIVRPACLKLEAFIPPSSHLLGNSMVGVRCPGKKEWSLFVPVHVTVTVAMLIINKPLPQGHVLRAEDISSQSGELSQLDIFTDPAQVTGKVLKYSIGAGQVLRPDMMRAPYAITQGQIVRLKAVGAGFSVQSEGHALGNAAEGQSVQVKTSSGQVISGTTQADGTVEIRP